MTQERDIPEEIFANMDGTWTLVRLSNWPHQYYHLPDGLTLGALCEALDAYASGINAYKHAATINAARAWLEARNG